MFAVDRLILLGGVLLILGIVSSKLSSRVGLPVLVLFLLVGMLAGSEGPGGIAFENYALAHGVGTAALVMILFDGGLRTDMTTFRRVIVPSVALASIGVFLTAAGVALAARAILELPWLDAMLLGSVVSSTDAAAVFAVLRSKGVRVRQRVAATLELESGSNDPMAVLLTVACIELLLGRLTPGAGVAWLFLKQLALGAAVGWLVGRATGVVVNRINLDAAGLYPVLTGAAALLAYGAAASVGGSGFLAVYIAGVMVGSRRLLFRRGVYLFHDGVAWLAQITMFVLLGLLSFPSRLVSAAGPALLVAGTLVLVARPLAVAVCLLPFRFSAREVGFIAWGGLKGAVPIILATYPLLRGLPGAEALFDVVFFAVVVSAVTQGWTLPLTARLLRLQRPPVPEPPVTLEITSLKDVEGDIVEYTLAGDFPAARRRIRDLSLPDGALVAMVVRGQQMIPPRGSTQLLPADHVFVLLRPETRWLVDRVFSSRRAPARAGWSNVEFPLRGEARLGELETFYDIRIEAPADLTLGEFLLAQLGDPVTRGRPGKVGPVTLTVREVGDGRVETVGLSIDTPAGGLGGGHQRGEAAG
ncbi:MAG: potassium/proton antiporter [Gemmatimonadetes bacterium]|nr:potassium/proton antiporter [Gemmatimonadota bacterium]